jgi:S-formylglutathione hydrolase FrmB
VSQRLRRAVAVIALASACHRAPIATVRPQVRAAPPSLPPPSPAPAPDAPRVRVALDASTPVEGNLFVTWLTADEWAELSRGAMGPFVDMMPRAAVVRARLGAAAVDVALPGAPPDGAMAFGVLDTQGRFFDTLFEGSVQGNAIGHAVIAAGSATLQLTALRSRAADADGCVGDRWRRITLDDPAVAGAIGNPTARRLCVRLPRSYATARRRRYPVVYLLPGLMGTDDVAVHHLRDPADEPRREALYVGVDTSTRAGSSYLVDGPLTGAWERFMVERVVPAVDAQLRTIPSAEARALAGHSTGGFDAVSLALRRPEVFRAVGASSPDALDLAAWMLGDDGRARPLWLGWMRVEDAMGGAGQLTSYGADWSPDPSERRGFAWPVDLATGDVRPAVWARWLAQSPVTWLDQPDGLARARRLAGRIYLTCGRADEARLFAPAERFAQALERAGVARVWAPTAWGHLGHARERWLPMLEHLLSVMTPAR